MDFTKEQRKFLDLYAISNDAVRSYKEAFDVPDGKSCLVEANRLLRKPAIREYLYSVGAIVDRDREERESNNINNMIIKNMLRQYSVQALKMIIDAFQNEHVKMNFRLRAAETIVNRALGPQCESVFDSEDLSWIDVIPESEAKCPKDADFIEHWKVLERKYKNAGAK